MKKSLKEIGKYLGMNSEEATPRQVQYCIPVIPADQEAAAGGSQA